MAHLQRSPLQCFPLRNTRNLNECASFPMNTLLFVSDSHEGSPERVGTWEVGVGGGKDDSKCTVLDEVTAAAAGGWEGLCWALLWLDAVLQVLQNVGRAGWTQETVGPGSGHYCLLLPPSHPTLHLCTLLAPVNWPQLTLCC